MIFKACYLLFSYIFSVNTLVMKALKDLYENMKLLKVEKSLLVLHLMAEENKSIIHT